MNTNTGMTYELGEDFVAQAIPSFHFTTVEQFRNEAERAAEGLERIGIPITEHNVVIALGRPLTTDERSALVDLGKGESIIAVAPGVAHAQRLGQRESERRKGRRKQQRESRKRNR